MSEAQQGHFYLHPEFPSCSLFNPAMGILTHSLFLHTSSPILPGISFFLLHKASFSFPSAHSPLPCCLPWLSSSTPLPGSNILTQNKERRKETFNKQACWLNQPSLVCTRRGTSHVPTLRDVRYYNTPGPSSSSPELLQGKKWGTHPAQLVWDLSFPWQTACL